MALADTKQQAASDLLATLDVPSTGWQAAARADAAGRLQAVGLPSRRDEYWKYTRPDALTASSTPAGEISAQEAIFNAVDAVKLVFVDGAFDAASSDDPALAGAEITTLAAAASLDIHWAKELYGILETRGQIPVERPLATLNTAAATDGVLIRVTGDAARPVRLIYRQSAGGLDAMVHHVIKLDEGASLTLLEEGAAATRFNSVLEVDVADDASFHHIRVQGRGQDHSNATHAFTRLGRESLFKSFTLSVNGVLTRNETVIEITGDDANAHVAGAAMGDGDFHHDDTIFITHDAVNCESRQVFKKVLRNGATGVFQGKILVKEGAQKTDGYQISQSLLLDEDAQFLAKPELEIYADDVACSHGSTSGAIDEDALFYLRSRGVPHSEATDMLTLSFLAEALEEIADEALSDVVLERLQLWMAERRG